MHYIAKKVQLPSYGKLYVGTKLFEVGGQVTVYPITIKTQKSLLVDNPKDFKLSLLLDSCTNLLELGFDYNQLVLGDGNALFLYIRQLTYGDVVEELVQCLQCKTPIPLFVNIKDIKITDWKDVNIEPVIKIDVNDYHFQFRHLFVKDRDVIFGDVLSKATEGKGIKSQDVLDFIIKSFAIRLIEFNGQKLSFEQSLELFQSLPIPILETIDKKLDEYVCGPDVNITVKCNGCQVTNTVNLFAGIDFFRLRDTVQFATKVSGSVIR
jgi:hypothetical protein